MKAMVHESYGSADVLRYADIDPPTVAEDEVLVRVRAASLNFGDRVALHGTPTIVRLAMGVRRPKRTVLGRDVAGTVEAVGAAVTRLRPGDDVFGEMEQCGFAEYVAAKEAFLAVKPAGVSFEQAATLPIAATTAWQALRAGGVGPGRAVLVNGASGGVGTFAVQLARALGAEVTATCRARNAEMVRSIGASHVIDYAAADVTRGPGRFDLILDLAGDHPPGAYRRILNPAGVYLASFGTGGRVLGPLPRMLAILARSVSDRARWRVFATRRNTGDLAELAGMVAAGTLKPVIERTYPLSGTAEAIRFIETEHPRGKVVLIP